MAKTFFDRFKGYIGLGRMINKVGKDGEELEEGVISDYLPELELDMSNDELEKLARCGLLLGRIIMTLI